MAVGGLVSVFGKLSSSWKLCGLERESWQWGIIWRRRRLVNYGGGQQIKQWFRPFSDCLGSVWAGYGDGSESPTARVWSAVCERSNGVEDPRRRKVVTTAVCADIIVAFFFESMELMDDGEMICAKKVVGEWLKKLCLIQKRPLSHYAHYTLDSIFSLRGFFNYSSISQILIDHSPSLYLSRFHSQFSNLPFL